MANTHTTLSSLFTDIADAIRGKTGATSTIKADNFPTAISEISTGIDTSDATAAASDINTGKTAYVNGVRITGTAELDPFAPYYPIETLIKPNGTSTGSLQLSGGDYVQVLCPVANLGEFSGLLDNDTYKNGGIWFFDSSAGLFVQHEGTFGGYVAFGVYNTAQSSTHSTYVDSLALSSAGPMYPTKFPNTITDLFTDSNTNCYSNVADTQVGTAFNLKDELFSDSIPVVVDWTNTTEVTFTFPQALLSHSFNSGLSIYFVIPHFVEIVLKNFDSFKNNLNAYDISIDDVKFYGKNIVGLHTSTLPTGDVSYTFDMTNGSLSSITEVATNESRWYVLMTKNDLI